MEKNVEIKLSINKVRLNTNQKSNSRYTDSNQKPSDKSLNYKKQTEENIISTKKKTKLTKRINSDIDVVKSGNISFDDENHDRNHFRRMSQFNMKDNGFKKIKSLVYTSRNRFQKLFKEDETGEEKEIERNAEIQEKKI